MKSRALWIALSGIVITASAVQAAPHDAHQAAGTIEQSAGVTQCAQAQLLVSRIVEDAQARLELARQSNSPSAMRAALDDLGSALRDIRVQLEPCAAMVATDSHAGHAMPPAPAAAPGTPAMKPGSQAAAPGAAAQTAKPSTGGADPHAGHATTPSSAPTKAPIPGARPRAAAPAAKPQAGAMGAPTAATLASAVDPVCGLKVDPTAAPRADHQGRAYYFCSEQHRQLFSKDSAKYVPKAGK